MGQTWVQMLADHPLLVRTSASCERVGTSLHHDIAVAWRGQAFTRHSTTCKWGLPPWTWRAWLPPCSWVASCLCYQIGRQILTWV